MAIYEAITSKHNPKIERWKKLSTSKQYRYETKSVLLEGKNLVSDLITSEKSNCITALIVSDSARKEAEHLFTNCTCKQYVLPDVLFKMISTVETPEGYIAECSMPLLGQKFHSSLREEISDENILGPCLILDQLQDPGNVGTLLRTAALFSVKTVIIIEPSCDIWNPKALRAAKGAHFYLNIVVASWKEITALQEHLSPFFATYPPGEDVISIRELQFTSQVNSKQWTLVLGNEGKGVSIPSDIKFTRVTIPTNTMLESLNVAQAGAICLYAFSL